MMRPLLHKLRKRLGSLIVLLAIALLAATILNPMRLGGDVWGGKVEDGRYFVVSKGHRYTEVSQTEWQIEQYLEAGLPWFPVMLLWLGLALRVTPETDPQPAARPSANEALQTLLIIVLIVIGSGAMAIARCLQCGVSWPLGIGVWLALWVSFFTVVGLDSRRAHPPSPANLDAASGLADA
jgi:hypothetical protein